MNRRRHPARGFMLVHVITTLPLAAMLLLLLGKLVLDALYVQRVASEHARIVDVSEGLARSLRQDALGATTWRLSDGLLRIETTTKSGPASVEYQLSTERIRRSTPGMADQSWAAPRLQFKWRVEDGPRGSVLWLDLSERAPARKVGVLTDSVVAGVLLPSRTRPLAALAEEAP